MWASKRTVDVLKDLHTHTPRNNSHRNCWNPGFLNKRHIWILSRRVIISKVALEGHFWNGAGKALSSSDFLEVSRRKWLNNIPETCFKCDIFSGKLFNDLKCASVAHWMSWTELGIFNVYCTVGAMKHDYIYYLMMIKQTWSKTVLGRWHEWSLANCETSSKV